MNLAIVGTGAIGSALAFHFSRAGHTVTCVARGERLRQLQADQAIVTHDGLRAPVHVAASLPSTEPFDLVLVTVLAPQVAAVMPALQASAAREIMFLFNTFESIEPLRAAVGPERFHFGFPGGVLCHLRDGRIRVQINPGTTVGTASWARVFTDAGIPTVAEADMQAWLRSHAAFVAPLMAISVRTTPLSWSDARKYTRATEAGFEAVRFFGHRPIPTLVGMLAAMPRVLLTFALWLFSRSKMARDLGLLGPQEARMLIDQMAALVPACAPPLIEIRP